MAEFKHYDLQFPCDCVSSTRSCRESWARVAKEGMFKGGTKENILNRLHHKPQTIAQLAKATNLAQPTIFRHISELSKAGLVRQFDPNEKDYVAERYHELNFPVISKADQRLFRKDVNELAVEIENAVKKRIPGLRTRFKGSKAAADGWTFAEFAHYVVHRAERESRKSLEQTGLLARKLRPHEGKSSGKSLDFVFWGVENASA